MNSIGHAGSQDSDPAEVESGLRLLALVAQAKVTGESERASRWVKRRVEKLEFIDTRAVRWHLSIDFDVPSEAPAVCIGNQEFRLVPVTTLPKGDLVAFDLRDETGAALWLPTSDESGRRLAPALVVIARRVLKQGNLELSTKMAGYLMHIVASAPSDHERAYRPFAAAAAWIEVEDRRKDFRAALRRRREVAFWNVRGIWRANREWRRARDALIRALAISRIAEQRLNRLRDLDNDVRKVAYRLMSDLPFRSQLEELAKDFVVHIGVASEPGTRRIVKLTAELKVNFWSSKGVLRLLQGLGWRCWPLHVLIGGRGGSHHLEVAAPPGVDIARIIAKPTNPEEQATISAAGFKPHVPIRVPASSPFRFRATIYVRISRSGWLSASLLVAIVIAVVMVVGVFKLPALDKDAPEAATAATLMLALLGVIAAWLIRPGEHPLASSMLQLIRVLILLDVADVLVGAGDLVLRQANRPPPTALWCGLAAFSVTVVVMVVLSWLMPRKLPWDRAE